MESKTALLGVAAGILICLAVESSKEDSKAKSNRRLRQSSRINKMPYYEPSQILREPEWPEVSNVRVCSNCGHCEEDY